MGLLGLNTGPLDTPMVKVTWNLAKPTTVRKIPQFTNSQKPWVVSSKIYAMVCQLFE
jgi:hypothetical protein